MTNDRIQKVLARIDKPHAQLTLQAQLDAVELLRFMAGPDGPIGIADQAAWEVITCECGQAFGHGYAWYDTGRPFISNVDDHPLMEEISRCAVYLTARGLLVQHPCHKDFVRHIDDEPLRDDLGRMVA